MTQDIERYAFEKLTGSDTLLPCVRPEGEWVKYADHEVLITTLRAERDAAQTSLQAFGELYDAEDKKAAEEIAALCKQIEAMEYSDGDAAHWRHLCTMAQTTRDAARENLLTMQDAAAKLLEDADAYKAAMTANLERALTAEALVQSMREALEPFAALAGSVFRAYEDGREMNAGKADDDTVWGFDRVDLTYGALRRARAVGKLTKLSAEREWCLKWWSQGGWTIGRPMSRGIKKWEKHIDMLVKAGLLETSEYEGPGAAMCRITDAGRAILAQAKP